MKLKFPEPVSFQPGHSVNLRDRVQALRNEITGDKLAWASERRNLITSRIAPNGPIQPRLTKPGNTSMYDHLAGLVQQLDADPEGQADRRTAELNADITRLEQGLVPVVRWSDAD